MAQIIGSAYATLLMHRCMRRAVLSLIAFFEENETNNYEL